MWGSGLRLDLPPLLCVSSGYTPRRVTCEPSTRTGRWLVGKNAGAERRRLHAEGRPLERGRDRVHSAVRELPLPQGRGRPQRPGEAPLFFFMSPTGKLSGNAHRPVLEAATAGDRRGCYYYCCCGVAGDNDACKMSVQDPFHSARTRPFSLRRQCFCMMYHQYLFRANTPLLFARAVL